ncbi:MAG: 50S ribosomal protein L18 [Candidatus Paceibacterota bacterium]|jgi:large subunit ribosomal protein L18
MNARKQLIQKRGRRANRVRTTVRGSDVRPRLSVFRSNKFTSVQLINDVSGKTLAQASSRESKKKMTKTAGAEFVGTTIAERAKALGVSAAVFDRGSYRYHGRVKALVEAARKGGLQI